MNLIFESKNQGKYIYTSLSRKTYNLYCIGELKKSATEVNKDVLLEYQRLKQNNLFTTIKRNTISFKTHAFV